LSAVTITVASLPTLTSNVNNIYSYESVTLTSLFSFGTATIDNVSTFNGAEVTNNATYIISPSVGTHTYTLRVVNNGITYLSAVTITVTARTGYSGIITFKLYTSGNGETYDVNMQYGNQTFISENNSENVSHEISNINRLQNPNSIITITTSNYGRQTTGNLYYYILNDSYFFYNNTIQSWGLGGNQYRIPASVGDNPLEFIIRLEADVPDD
jgi:hypothetical protein